MNAQELKDKLTKTIAEMEARTCHPDEYVIQIGPLYLREWHTCQVGGALHARVLSKQCAQSIASNFVNEAGQRGKAVPFETALADQISQFRETIKMLDKLPD